MMTISSIRTPDRTLPIHPNFVPETIYRRFFLAGILVILTAGAVWGAFLLWQVSRAGSFTGVSIHAVNAHGHAQIFGWVGLFIMGFAYQAFPRMWGTRLVGPHLAVTAFVIMIISLVLSTIGTATAETWSFAVSAVVFGGVLQIVAVVIFAGQLLVTFRRSDEPMSPAMGFIFMALFWFLIMSVMNLWHTVALMQAETREALLAQIATYQAALRDLQIHGLALCMILGVSMRFFPGMFGLAKTSAVRGWWALSLIQVAIVVEVALLIGSQLAGSYALAGALVVPWLMLATGVALVVVPWKLWRPMPQWSRSDKFVRIAYLWLGISLVMLLMVPVYMVLRDMTFSHAYYGAMRHAITVGFISMMIMGVAAKVVPVLSGIDARQLSALWVPFILVNAGCALRVSMQVLTDWHDVGFSIIAVSGMMEVTGLAWWGIGLAAIMWRGKRRALPTIAAPPRATGSSAVDSRNAPALDLNMKIREIANAHPHLQPTLAELGLDTCCMGEKTLEQAARLQGMEPEQMKRIMSPHSRP